MLIRKQRDVSENEVINYDDYLNRRQFLKASAGMGLATFGTTLLNGTLIQPASAKVLRSRYSTSEKPTDYDDITHYNNFYEFGTGKSDPARYADKMMTSPWSVRIEGECESPGRYHLEDLLKPLTEEERIYRFRCVEGWSMVIPWQGVPLAELIKRMKPTSRAKYVYFETLSDATQMRAIHREILDWPYVEGLRMDEAMHPLTILGTGIYGKDLLNQNGAPLRLVVPWKYGFKSIKSIVKIRFSESQPRTTWQKAGEDEYGFYANVNPDVPHPRWSQRKERVIGSGFFAKKKKTRLFNGYAEQVADLYRGMDLVKNF